MKSEENKTDKENRLLKNGFKLFTEKGINKTSVQDIVDSSNMAKGTFYLYFKDKYELRDIIITKKSEKLFNDAVKNVRSKNISNFTEQIITVIDYVIDELTKDTILLKFISKNLSWGVYSKTLVKIYEKSEQKENGLYTLFLKGVEENNINLKSPEVTLFMIVELVSSTCFNSILHNEPLPINEYKPYLYDVIKHLIEKD